MTTPTDPETKPDAIGGAIDWTKQANTEEAHSDSPQTTRGRT